MQRTCPRTGSWTRLPNTSFSFQRFWRRGDVLPPDFGAGGSLAGAISRSVQIDITPASSMPSTPFTSAKHTHERLTGNLSFLTGLQVLVKVARAINQSVEIGDMSAPSVLVPVAAMSQASNV